MQEQVELVVAGMHCGGCEERAARAVTRLHGVLGAAANHATGVVRVSFNPGQVSASAIAERLDAAGFPLADAGVEEEPPR